MSRPYSDARIGLDLDNTLISYDRLFLEIAVERGVVPKNFAGTKRDIRDRIRLLPDGDLEWQRLQAHVYGSAIGTANPAPGALDFIRAARLHGAELAIVSHKTTFANVGTHKVNLRDAAREWLRARGMVGPDAVPESNVYFESTRNDKIERIISLRCTHFIDDLEEVFNDPAFPTGVKRLLLSAAATVPSIAYQTYASFHEIADAFVAD
jgi:hypothetical protein